jgi:hypothetical protein
MYQDENPYPNLYKLVRSSNKHRTLWWLLAGIVLSMLGGFCYVHPRYGEVEEPLYWQIGSVLFLIASGVAWLRIIRHLLLARNSSHEMNAFVARFDNSPRAEHLEKIETELNGNCVEFSRVIVTDNYLVSKRTFGRGGFTPLHEIGTVRSGSRRVTPTNVLNLNVLKFQSNLFFTSQDRIFVMDCETLSAGDISLTDQQEEFEPILTAIRLRYPEVRYDKTALDGSISDHLTLNSDSF